jgi:hypothetical protein
MSDSSLVFPADFAGLGLAARADPAYAERLIATLKGFAQETPDQGCSAPSAVSPLCEAA